MLIFTNVTWLDLCLASAGVYLVMQAFSKKNPAPYPPGPPGWPLIGNIADMPHNKAWLTFAKWGKKYGDILHVEVLGRHIIVLNSVKAAIDLLDKKGSIYSDRPVLQWLVNLLAGSTVWVFSLMVTVSAITARTYTVSSAVRTVMNVYEPMEEIEVRRFLKRVFAQPEQLQAHIRHTAGAIILRISYGYEVKDNNDPFVDLADRAMDQFSQSIELGALHVANVPEWFPGAGFKCLAREWRQTVKETVDAPYKFAKDQIAAGIAPMSYTSNLLKGRTLSAEEDHMVKWSAVSLYTGGSDTTVSTIYSIFLAMTLFPDVQKKAQAEIDAVVGTDRLPSFADRDSLPYIEALVKESLRWFAVGPIGIPHCVSEDDIYDGYHIPKGSMIIPNIWFMLNDPHTYTNPSQFNPERFLDNDGRGPERDSRTICFGFGRRICPGIHLVDASVWISIVMSLAVFDISKIVENGVEHTLSHPKPFKCSIKPRSPKAIALIQENVNH
ncbi:cytochrome P450 [Suillus bovinus]|uniref:cytochrome P450 n=1 Tax=Suillus bovinus TaxID=48563 RepID=UPI001B870FFB|nr:cytochrome P450 [Suillus bovinus]KAG2151680.1 cytochrome P450 [Suillus bovinus]